MIALFDLDGVITDTESQYSLFWNRMGKDYLGLEDFGKTLPEDELDVFKLRWLKGLTHREISAKLHRSERTVKRMTNDMKRKFAKFENIGTV